MNRNSFRKIKLQNERRLLAGRIAHRIETVFLLAFLLTSSVCPTFADERSEGPILGNPMQKHFDAPSENATPNRLDRSAGMSRSPLFADQTILSNESDDIRQAAATTSDSLTSGSVWGQPTLLASNNVSKNSVESSVDNSGRFVGWGIGPPVVPSTSPSSARSTPSESASSGGASQHGWGIQGSPLGGIPGNGVFGIGPTNPNFGVNAHFNTGTDHNASPMIGSDTNLPSYSPMYSPPPNSWNAQQLAASGAGAVGFGYYDPLSGQYLYGNPYSMQGMAQGMSPGMPYGYGMQSGLQPGMPNASFYGMSGSGMPDSMLNPMANPYTARQNAYGTQNPYGGDLFGNMLLNGGLQDPMLLQAMLQQEAIRHQLALEAEEEEERKREEEDIEKTEQAKKEAAEQWSMNQLMPISVSSPLAKTAWNCAKTLSPFNTPSGPDRGVGMPLQHRSWLDRPCYFGGFVGSIDGSTLVSDRIRQNDGAIGGLILGNNINEYWGIESRLHFASIDIEETEYGRQLYEQVYGEGSAAYLTTRTNQLTTLDVSVHYYPLGNAKFRPFFKYGLGVTREAFRDTFGAKYNIDTMSMPIGVGLRYWWNDRLAIQADLIDNIVFSRSITKTQNNWAFTVGLTYSFGSSKKRRPIPYWPYTPSTGSRH